MVTKYNYPQAKQILTMTVDINEKGRIAVVVVIMKHFVSLTDFMQDQLSIFQL